jgi:hypothetical protein
MKIKTNSGKIINISRKTFIVPKPNNPKFKLKEEQKGYLVKNPFKKLT